MHGLFYAHPLRSPGQRYDRCQWPRRARRRSREVPEAAGSMPSSATETCRLSTSAVRFCSRSLRCSPTQTMGGQACLRADFSFEIDRGIGLVASTDDARSARSEHGWLRIAVRASWARSHRYKHLRRASACPELRRRQTLPRAASTSCRQRGHRRAENDLGGGNVFDQRKETGEKEPWTRQGSCTSSSWQRQEVCAYRERL